MTRPLYSEVTRENLNHQSGNTGLWYDKFFDQWDGNFTEISPEGKKRWIKGVTDKLCGDKEQLEQTQTRVAELLDAHGQPPLFYKLESDFVTGLGREHPVENGFAWHHTLGTPYLPGSSVKGVVRAWAEGWHEWAGKKEDELSAEEQAELETYEQDLKRIFGDTDKTGAGSVIFLDALPKEPVQLKADVMTPHYGPYYQDKAAKTPPADWHSPNPIPFLVVQAGASFVFGILPRRHSEKSRDDCNRVRDWLEDALCWSGAGAKTAVGYGRFTVDGRAQQEAEQERTTRELKQKEHEAEVQRQNELAQMSPVLRELYEDGFEKGDFIGQPMQKWLARMQQVEGEEKLEIARHLKAWYQQHRAEQWGKPNKKNAEKIAPIKKVLGEK